LRSGWIGSLLPPAPRPFVQQLINTISTYNRSSDTCSPETAVRYYTPLKIEKIIRITNNLSPGPHPHDKTID
jgi:hypothetical protein